MADKPYFHEMTKQQVEAMLPIANWKVDVFEKYEQPPWCSYPNALDWYCGCWSLTEAAVHSEADCSGCDLYKSE